MPLAFLCDFDGTVAPDDIGASLVSRFGRVDAPELVDALARWRAGTIGHRELTTIEGDTMRVTEAEARAFASRFAIDPAFAPFAQAAERDGQRVSVVSEGFDFYIADLLRREGLAHVPYTANRLRFDGDRVVAEFPNPGGCGRCGNCKGERVLEQRRAGHRVVLVGDGLSDRCGAAHADHVLARGDLLAWCRATGVAATPFQDFTDVARWARERAGANGAPAAERPC